MKNNKTYKSRIQKFRNKYHLKSRQAHSKYMLFSFAECLHEISSEFVFKGGNIIWFYTLTPRETVDIDMIMNKRLSESEILGLVKKACAINPDFGFHLVKHRLVEKNIDESSSALGLRAWIGYSCEGMKNAFYVDIVCPLFSDSVIESMPPNGKKLQIATLENIIADKLKAIFRFGTGNTRMKDYDDLYRILKGELSISKKKLKAFLIDLPRQLPDEYIEHLSKRWKDHTLDYPDLPQNFVAIFQAINKFLSSL